MKTTKRKRTGRLSKEEWAYIDANKDKMTLREIAVALNHTVDPIRRYLENKKLTEFRIEGDDERLLKLLHSKYYWPEVKQQFSEHELRYFEHRWVELVKQFSEDITSTEENEMIELIRVSILINRLMKDKQEIIDSIERLNQLIDIEMDKGENANTNLIAQFQSQIAGYMASKSSFIKEYKELVTCLEKYLKDLKGTRESRLKRADDAKTNFNSYLRLLDEDAMRTTEGRYAEMTALAGDKAAEKLGQYITYSDGQLDKPIFSADTVE